ncbi:MAG TPA: GTPase CgtA [Clostridiales bacterium]|jgi:GTP-binding protein|nr:GTPase CgtA [Clostridiales bacterium]
MFIDKANIIIRAGNGGNGIVSFHREKYISRGGPDGGDGGKGGSVIFEVDPGENTLLPFRYRHHFYAENGQDGKSSKMYGKNGQDLIIKIPPGTIIRDKNTGKIMFDIGRDKRYVAAKGGKGGWGNSHFATPTRQIPRFAKSGGKGEEKELTLELKMLADVGLVGMPNVGKSTLLSVMSAARPKIANYPFTTLSPVLGMVSLGEGKGFVIADIPGLVEGASEGVGLGHDFLRHIDRCRLLVHLIDASGTEGRNPLHDIAIIERELARYDDTLSSRVKIIVANKSDLGVPEEIKEELEAYCQGKDLLLLYLSAATHQGVDALLTAIANLLQDLPPMIEYEPEYEEEELLQEDRSINIIKQNNIYVVEGEWLLRVMSNVNFDDRESLAYFQKVLRKTGVIEALEYAGIQNGDTVSIYDFEFDFIE